MLFHLSIDDDVGHFGNRETVPGVAHPGATGVIYCTDRAMANGFAYGNGEWVRGCVLNCFGVTLFISFGAAVTLRLGEPWSGSSRSRGHSGRASSNPVHKYSHPCA